MKPGQGRIALHADHGRAVLSELSSTYPLKLLASRNPVHNVAIVYSLSYGGGLVGGDLIELHVEVESHCILVLLSQGSTKVFKTRSLSRQARVLADSTEAVTQQSLSIYLAPSTFILLLPDPVTCFRASAYRQIQKFHLSSGASLILLDWLTSGRASTGEAWEFHRYYSCNEIWLDSKCIARDVLLLDHTHANSDTKGRLPNRTLADRLAPYSCYATLILIGPLVRDIVADIQREYSKISVFQRGTVPENLMWSLSPLRGDSQALDEGWIVRVAATETEAVKRWLAGSLKPLEDVVGEDVYRRTFA